MFWVRVEQKEWEEKLRALVEAHACETQSPYAAMLLHKWDEVLPHFWQVVPKDYAKVIGFAVPEQMAISA